MVDIISPLNIKNKIIKNRVVAGPTEKMGLLYSDGIMGDDSIREYEEVARTDVGLIICQSLMISQEDFQNRPMELPCAYDEKHVPYLKRMVDSVHENSTCFIAQLAPPPQDQSDTTEELEVIRDNYINAAHICFKAGFDGVEIHGAHRFFLNLLTSPKTNHRTDKYKDGLIFVREIVDGIKEFVDDDFILSYRMGACFDWGKDVQTAQKLEKIGFDLIDVSFGIAESYPSGIPSGYEYSEITFAASQIIKAVNIPVIAVWEITTLNSGNYLIMNNQADLVAYARSFLADNKFFEKSKENMNYSPCHGCVTCNWYIHPSKCPSRIKNK